LDEYNIPETLRERIRSIVNAANLRAHEQGEESMPEDMQHLVTQLMYEMYKLGFLDAQKASILTLQSMGDFFGGGKNGGRSDIIH
jgi:hypothetical protein